MINLNIFPWQATSLYVMTSQRLKQQDKLPAYVKHLTAGTVEYEAQIRLAWEHFKENPTEENAAKFAELMKSLSRDMWPRVFADVLGINLDDMIPEQHRLLEDALDEHHSYIEKSLLPDILKAMSAGNLSSLDYRTTFLYAGALWSLGNVATVMFNGLSLRDLTDVFMFAGPNDDATCTGERGCARYANRLLTVAEILAGDIFPGKMRCLTNCRHFLLPIASPFREKHIPGGHDQYDHTPKAYLTDLGSMSANELRSRGYIAVYRGTGARGMQHIRPSTEGQFGPGVYFYDDPLQARAYAEVGGGIITGFVHPDDVQVEEVPGSSFTRPHRIIVLQDVEKLIRRGDIPTEETVITGYDYASFEKRAESALDGIQLKHIPGGHDQYDHTPKAYLGAGADAEFARSPVGQTLDALADDYDFVLFGSAALRLHLGERMGRLPNDIDVIDMYPKAPDDELSGRFEHLDDPRAPMNPHWIDDMTGIKVSAYDAGQIMDTISGMKAPIPSYDYTTGKYTIDKIGKFSVMPLEDIVRAKLYGRDTDIEDVERAIAALELPRDYITDDSRYQRLWDMGDWRNVLKHQLGQHDQHDHTPKAYLHGGGADNRIAQLADPGSDINKKARDNWDKLSDKERMALFDPEAIYLSMTKELGRYSKDFQPSHKLVGKELNRTSLKHIQENARKRINSLHDALNPVTEAKLKDYVDNYMDKAVKAAIKEGSLKDVTAEDMDNLMQSNINKLVYQEIESRKRQLGDHGIRHVLGNLEAANAMLDDPDMPKTSALERLMINQTMVDHDMGYTAGVVTKSFEATKYHEKYSAEYAKAQGYEKFFGDRTPDMIHMVATHAETDLDWQGDHLNSAIRTADNLALFSKEKMPALFYDVPGAMPELYRLQLAAQSGQTKDIMPAVKDSLRQKIKDYDIDSRQKVELNQAIDEIFPYSGKFALGMEAGEIAGYDYRPDGIMEVHIKHRQDREALNGVFDLGERQFKKFLDSYETTGTPGDGLQLSKAGKHVMDIKYEESETQPRPELAQLYNASVRPVIHSIDRQLGSSPSKGSKESLWNWVEGQLENRVTPSELKVFKQRYMAGTLGTLPLTEKEQEFLRTARLKELFGELDLSDAMLLDSWLLKHLPDKHSQRDHTPKAYCGEVLKHLPGKHYQRDHTPYIYAGSTPVTRDWFEDGGSKLFEQLHNPVVKKMIIDTLVDYKVTQEELEGMSGFSTQPARNYELNSRGYYKWTGSGEDEDIQGLYDPGTRMIHVPEIMAYREDGPWVVLHELGHHVTMTNKQAPSNIRKADQVREEVEHLSNSRLAYYGLRKYSLTNGRELLADSYMIMKAGNASQKANLEKLWREYADYESLEEVFKEFVTALELQARERNGMIEIIAVPVEVDQSVVNVVPWYYITKEANNNG